MTIIKVKKVINRVEHIFTLNEESSGFVSNRDEEFVISFHQLIVWNNVHIIEVKDSNDNIITVNETLLDDMKVIRIDIESDEYIFTVIDEDDSEQNISQEDDYTVSQQPAVGTSTLEEIQARIISANTRPLRIQGIIRNRRETPKQFLVKFFKGGDEFEGWNETKNTLYADDAAGIQTEAGKRRSIGDIFMILRYYYPQITLKEVVQLLYIDLIRELNDGLRTSNCGQIHKRVWYYDTDEGGQFMEASQRDEYGNNKSFYVNSLR